MDAVFRDYLARAYAWQWRDLDGNGSPAPLECRVLPGLRSYQQQQARRMPILQRPLGREPLTDARWKPN